MANLRVSLVIYAKRQEGKGWTRHPAVRGANGRIRPGFGMVNGQPKKFDTYTYQLRSYEGTRLVYKTVGEDAANANAQQIVTEKNRAARHEAKIAGVAVVEESTRRHLATAVEQYLQRATNKRKFVAAQVYRTSLEAFRQSAPDVVYVDQITEDTLLAFHAYLRRRGNSERTIANRHGHVKSLLLWCEVSRQQIKKAMGDPPTFEKKKVVAYNRDEMSSLFAACDDPYFATVLRLLQMTGLREAEATHLMWTDIDFKRKQILVRSKPELGFQLKDREERIIPLPAELAAILQKRRKASPKSKLVVGTDEDMPHTKWLRLLKRLARQANMNCGHCRTCRETQNRECKHWTLHSFRRSYATTLDEAGFSLKQIMDLLGHSDIATTMRYLGSRSLKSHQLAMEKVRW
jgi:integrase